MNAPCVREERNNRPPLLDLSPALTNLGRCGGPRGAQLLNRNGCDQVSECCALGQGRAGRHGRRQAGAGAVAGANRVNWSRDWIGRYGLDAFAVTTRHEQDAGRALRAENRAPGTACEFDG